MSTQPTVQDRRRGRGGRGTVPNTTAREENLDFTSVEASTP